MSSMFNKTKAGSCPRSLDEYLEAASNLCPRIGEEYNYICVPNANKTDLVQFCFHQGKFPAWQIAEHCPYLHNSGYMNSENCSSFSYGCPRKYFRTRESFKYPACLEINHEKGCYVAESNCYYNVGNSKSGASAGNPSSTSAATVNEITLALSVVFGVAFFLLISLFASYFIYRRRKRNFKFKDSSKLNMKQRVNNRNTTKKHEGKECEDQNLLKQWTEENDGPNAQSRETEEVNFYNARQFGEKIKENMHKRKGKINSLHVSCRKGNLKMCQHIITNYPDMLYQIADERWNAALFAAMGGNVEVLELLAKHDVDLRHKNSSGGDILDVACENSKLGMCQHIIKLYPEMLGHIDNSGWNTALHAAKGGNVEILELLTKNDVNPKHKNNCGGNILQIACKHSTSEMCQYIIKHYPGMLNQVDNEGKNAALYAAEGGNVEILELLSNSGAELEHKSNLGINIFHIACANSKLEMCQHIIKRYPDMLKQVDKRGWNAALCAAYGGNVEILKLLAKNGIDLTYKRNRGNNILHTACVTSNLEMCQHIIKCYPDMLKHVDNDGWNAALCAAQGGNIEILKLLAKNGVDLKHKSNLGINIFHIACAKSELEICQYVIKHYPSMLKQVGNNGWNAALYAAEGGNVEILELLAKHNVDLTKKSNSGCNILHVACTNSKIEMCRHIIKHYPDILKHVNNEGWNAALFASQGGNVAILELLATTDVDLTYKSNGGCNILHIACTSSKLEMCRHIIKHYPETLKQVDNNGWNAALHAAKGGNVEIVKLLAKNGVDLKHKNSCGSSILDIACMNSELKMCEHIQKHFPKMLKQVDNEGWNTALYAAKGGNVKILELLLNNGVDLTCKNNHGGNILHIACANSKLEMCRHIIKHYPDMLNKVDNNGWSAALHAVEGGNVEVLELLVENGVNISNN